VVWPQLAAGVLLGMVLTPLGTVVGELADGSRVLQVLAFGAPLLVGALLFVRRRTRSSGAGVLLVFAVFWLVVVPASGLLSGG
jgi:hypothetical protein